MNPSSTIDVLNQLVALHGRSLPLYLADAAPWNRYANADAMETLKAIVADKRAMVDRFAGLIISRGGTVGSVAFPTEFTDLNDLSVDFLLPKMVEQQRQEMAQIEQAISHFGGDPTAKSVAEEALGTARGHLQSLEELVQASSSKHQPALGRTH